jgi:uncharacterized Fe-S center protein
MSQVLFFKYDGSTNPLAGLRRLITKSQIPDMIPNGEKVAVKLHMGELGNIRYLRPAFARQVVDLVKKAKGKPFLFDTVAAYPGERRTSESYLRTAAKNGFVRASVNAPISIAGDEDEQRAIPITSRVDGCELEEARVPSLLLDSAFLVVLSHLKGHELTGMGGAIKNLGMGCVSTKTKQAQHHVNMPTFNDDGECDACGKCVQACPRDAIELVEGNPVRETVECTACGTCHFVCPPGCWAWPLGSKDRLQVYLSHAAGAVMHAFQGRVVFINFIQDVVPLCDCAPASGQPIVQDVGIALSLDPVALDKASVDLVDQAPIIPGATSCKPPDLLGKIHGTSTLIQLETAQKLKLGSVKYELVAL